MGLKGNVNKFGGSSSYPAAVDFSLFKCCVAFSYVTSVTYALVTQTGDIETFGATSKYCKWVLLSSFVCSELVLLEKNIIKSFW